MFYLFLLPAEFALFERSTIKLSRTDDVEVKQIILSHVPGPPYRTARPDRFTARDDRSQQVRVRCERWIGPIILTTAVMGSSRINEVFILATTRRNSLLCWIARNYPLY